MRPITCLLMALLIALVTGCSLTLEDVESAGEQYSAKKGQANDLKLRAYEAGLCKSVSVGAWVRKYGNDETKAEAWRQLCQDTHEETP